MMLKTCKNCGAEFESDRTQRKYCCLWCSNQGQRQSQKEWKTKNPEKIAEYEIRRTQKIIGLCRFCGRQLFENHIVEHWHDDCVIEDIKQTIRNRKACDSSQISRKRKLGISILEIKREMKLNGSYN